MASSGLSRRRAAVTSSSANDEEEPWNSLNANGSGSRAVSPSNSSAQLSSQGQAPKISHAGSAFEGGSKVAYDPRDLVNEDGDDGGSGAGKAPKLTLMEEVLLLGLKDKQGYLSFWNDNISYVLRGCILLELALQRRICIVRDASRKRYPLTERLVEVMDERRTGETLLDETLRLMKGVEAEGGGGKISVQSWVDLLSGETWNVMKIGFQLKQVRERLAKGLVDKGVLRTEKRNFLLFDMATHPVADARTKQTLVNRVSSLLTSTTRAVPPEALADERDAGNYRVMRSVALICSASAASVLDNALVRLGYDAREAAIQRAEDILSEFSSWPLGTTSGSGPSKRRDSTRIGVGSGGSGGLGGLTGREAVTGLVERVRSEMSTSGSGTNDGEDCCFELVAAVLEVLGRLDSLL